MSNMEYMKKKSNNNKFKDHGLNVPEHYFESVDARIFQQLQSESNSEFSKGKVKFLWWPYIAAAASLMLVWHVYQLNESSSVNVASDMAVELIVEELNPYTLVSLNETELLATLDQEDYEFLYNEAIEWDEWEEEALEQAYLFTEFQLMN